MENQEKKIEAAFAKKMDKEKAEYSKKIYNLSKHEIEGIIAFVVWNLKDSKVDSLNIDSVVVNASDAVFEELEGANEFGNNWDITNDNLITFSQKNK